MWTEFGTEPYVRTPRGLRSHCVVSQGVRHVVIDILPRDVLTYRTVCNLDVTADDRPSDPTECERCRRLEGPRGAS